VRKPIRVGGVQLGSVQWCLCFQTGLPRTRGGPRPAAAAPNVTPAPASAAQVDLIGYTGAAAPYVARPHRRQSDFAAGRGGRGFARAGLAGGCLLSVGPQQQHLL
jgi:hypothetical protein